MHRQALTSTPDPLAPLAGLGHWLAATAALTGVSWAAGAALAQLLRSRDLHWSWGLVLLLAACLMRSSLTGAFPFVVMGALCATLRSRRRHIEDAQAGADLAQDAAGRRTPLDAFTARLGALELRRRRAAGPQGWLRGDELVLGSDGRGRLVSIPCGSDSGTHTLLVGATGSGKTVTQTWMTVRSIERGSGAIIVDPKGDRDMRDAVMGAARAAGRDFIAWSPQGPCVYNPFARGGDTEIADKVLAGERFTEPHYLRQAQRMLGHVVRALRAAGAEVDLRSIVAQLDPDNLELLVRRLPSDEAEATEAYLDSLTTRQRADLAGVRDRLAILAESDVARWLDSSDGPARRFDLLEAAQQRAVVYFDLDADSRPLLTQMLGAAIVQDLQTTVAALQGRPAPTVVVIDEFSTLAAEHIVRLFARARSAGFSLVLSTQELSDLRLRGRDGLLDQVMGNLSTLLAHRQNVPSSAELIASLAGTSGAWRTSRNGDGRVSRTRVRTGALDADAVMGLAPGCAAAIVLSDGRPARIAQVLRGDGRHAT